MSFKDFSNNNGNGNNGGGNGGNGGNPLIPSGFMPGGGADVGGEDLLINYNEKFKNEGYALHREKEVQSLKEVLASAMKPNALIVGPAGCGKTKLVEDLAYSLANDDDTIPKQLKGYTIYELPLCNIVAGSSFVGQVEEKLQGVLDFAMDPKEKVILFIDEIHQLMGGSSTYEKIAQIMKPALARGELKVIGATTTQEAKTLLDDPALSRRFSKVICDEMSKEHTLDILFDVLPKLIMHYKNVSVSDEAIECVLNVADRYKTEYQHRPDNAINLLDKSMAHAQLNRAMLEIKAKDDPALAQMLASAGNIALNEKLITEKAIDLITGGKKSEKADFGLLAEKFKSIQGQDEALEIVTTALKRDALDVFEKTKPLSFLLAGPSGVGKTATAKVVAEVLTGGKPIVLNMTEFHSPASINRLIGAPAGYVGSDSHQELPFDCLESNPYQVIVLDEFEKADSSVQRLFMSALDEGVIKTNRNTVIDFSKSIIIATTNAGNYSAKKTALGFGAVVEENSAMSTGEIVDLLSKWFDNALIGRFTRIIAYNSIGEDMYKSIVKTMYEKEKTRIESEHKKITLKDIDDADLEEICKRTYAEETGARPAEMAVRGFIEDQLM